MRVTKLRYEPRGYPGGYEAEMRVEISGRTFATRLEFGHLEYTPPYKYVVAQLESEILALISKELFG